MLPDSKSLAKLIDLHRIMLQEYRCCFYRAGQLCFSITSASRIEAWLLVRRLLNLLKNFGAQLGNLPIEGF